jgi:hypothetical protein
MNFNAFDHEKTAIVQLYQELRNREVGLLAEIHMLRHEAEMKNVLIAQLSDKLAILEKGKGT